MSKDYREKDKVRVLTNTQYFRDHGEVGVIVKVDGSLCTVFFDTPDINNDYLEIFHVNELELIESDNSSIQAPEPKKGRLLELHSGIFAVDHAQLINVDHISSLEIKENYNYNCDDKKKYYICIQIYKNNIQSYQFTLEDCKTILKEILNLSGYLEPIKWQEKGLDLSKWFFEHYMNRGLSNE